MTEAGIWDWSIEQGADVNKVFRFKDTLGVYVDLTGYSASLTARYNRTDGEFAIEASIANGKLVIENLTYLRLRMSEEETTALKGGTCVYDFDLQDSLGNTVRWLKGTIYINQQVEHLV